MHLLVTLADADKPDTAAKVDKLVRARLPDDEVSCSTAKCEYEK